MTRPDMRAADAPQPLEAADFETFRTLLLQRSGLVVTPDKQYLLESRLAAVARRWRLDSLAALAAAIRMQRNADLVRDVVEAMTTNETSFFRDQKPFDQFRHSVLPALLRSRAQTRRIRIWSAACSSGQEAYSLAMMLSEEEARLSGWTVEIVGTDISAEMVAKASAGLYSQFEVQRGLPIAMLVKHFRQIGEKWQIAEALRARVRFRQFNLLEPPANLGAFDVVFCRNVLIYFDMATKAGVLDGIAGVLAPDGFLQLGAAETMLGISQRFQQLDGQRGLYVAARAPLRAAG